MDNQFLLSLIFITSSFLLSLAVTFIYIDLAKKLNISSKPHVGGVRQDIVPTGGGICFGLVYFISFIIYSNFFFVPDSYAFSIIFGSSLILIIGFLDDIFTLTSSFRLLIQFIFILFIGYIFNIQDLVSETSPIAHSFLLFIYLIGLVWLINTFNFIDGADGLVCTNSIVFSVAGSIFFFLSESYSIGFHLLTLSAVCSGFLIFNWKPAKVFMGDCGSLYLGSVFVIYICGSIVNNEIPIWVWIILFSVFHIETTVTLLVRIWRGKNVLKEHHSLHAYQQIILLTGDHSKPTKVSLIINLFWCIPLSLLCYFYPEYGPILAIITAFPLVLIFYYNGPYKVK
ncbi:MAG: hypothetical protein H8E74_10750 [Gammaproteobacteria bacterium]|nr:hypothetical protein [Gammaproteobacteria bacterium]